MRVVGAERAEVVGAPKVETLLGALVCRVEEVIPAERLAYEIWGARPPRRWMAALHVHVSQLRKVLGRIGGDPDGVKDRLVTRAPGYALLLGEGDAVDAKDFHNLVCQGRSALRRDRLEEASKAFGAALALWRGPAFGDVRVGSMIAEFATWAEETRMECTELKMEVDLRMGRDRELIGPLRNLVTEHPLREAFARQLMIALCRAERPADALKVYRFIERTLDQELGVQPGRTLRELQRRILADDQDIPVGIVA
ncbi:AfsR/SARP family transcriptional regulator [Actinokineospora auranticolor]|uniref:AfsR/SARP family transcriptional regulator n=1 Tax=Actinokineospora auranticolor TaxID=155976 RepID=UPI001C682732|nr:AfsR/SARP family transcriptional regulator [Actinokineospora auranticolor]